MTACVIGAGPAGVCATLSLLRRGIRCHWIDPVFTAGRLSLYETVPANTKLDVLLSERLFHHPVIQHVAGKEGRVREAIRQIQSTAYRLPHLEQRDPTDKGWTTLGRVGDIFSALTKYIIDDCRDVVTPHYAIADAVHRESDGSWTVATSSGSRIEASTVWMCIGGIPSTPMHIPNAKAIHLDDALNLELLRALSPTEQRIAVVGNSHSAAIVLHNLQQLGARSVTVYQRRPVRFALWDARIPEYRFSSTGLKGLGAEVVEQLLEDTPDWLRFETLSHPDAVLKCDKIILATGYQQPPMPAISGATYYERRNEETSEIAPGMYGIGIAWPEQAGIHWAAGLSHEDGFNGEWLVAWTLFLKRSLLVAEELQSDEKSYL